MSIVLWVLAAVLAALFLFTGVMKLAWSKEELTANPSIARGPVATAV